LGAQGKGITEKPEPPYSAEEYERWLQYLERGDLKDLPKVNHSHEARTTKKKKKKNKKGVKKSHGIGTKLPLFHRRLKKIGVETKILD